MKNRAELEIGFVQCSLSVRCLRKAAEKSLLVRKYLRLSKGSGLNRELLFFLFVCFIFLQAGVSCRFLMEVGLRGLI